MYWTPQDPRFSSFPHYQTNVAHLPCTQNMNRADKAPLCRQDPAQSTRFAPAPEGILGFGRQVVSGMEHRPGALPRTPGPIESLPPALCGISWVASPRSMAVWALVWWNLQWFCPCVFSLTRSVQRFKIIKFLRNAIQVSYISIKLSNHNQNSIRNRSQIKNLTPGGPISPRAVP